MTTGMRLLCVGRDCTHWVSTVRWLISVSCQKVIGTDFFFVLENHGEKNNKTGIHTEQR